LTTVAAYAAHQRPRNRTGRFQGDCGRPAQPGASLPLSGPILARLRPAIRCARMHRSNRSSSGQAATMPAPIRRPVRFHSVDPRSHPNLLT
jgi:hypothetical protein